MNVLARLAARILFLLLLLVDLMVAASFYLSPWGFFILAIAIAPALWVLGSFALVSAGEPKAALWYATWPLWFAGGLFAGSLFGEDAALTAFILGTVALNVAVIYAIHLVLGRPVVAGVERIK